MNIFVNEFFEIPIKAIKNNESNKKVNTLFSNVFCYILFNLSIKFV